MRGNLVPRIQVFNRDAKNYCWLLPTIATTTQKGTTPVSKFSNSKIDRLCQIYSLYLGIGLAESKLALYFQLILLLHCHSGSVGHSRSRLEVKLLAKYFTSTLNIYILHVLSLWLGLVTTFRTLTADSFICFCLNTYMKPTTTVNWALKISHTFMMCIWESHFMFTVHIGENLLLGYS